LDPVANVRLFLRSYDLRPFLYNVRWTWQFARIDALVRELETPVIVSGEPTRTSAATAEEELQAALARIKVLEQQLKEATQK
jgi:hypothetical protein